MSVKERLVKIGSKINAIGSVVSTICAILLCFFLVAYAFGIKIKFKFGITFEFKNGTSEITEYNQTLRYDFIHPEDTTAKKKPKLTI